MWDWKSVLVLSLLARQFQLTFGAQESIEYFAGLANGLSDPGNLVYELTVIFFLIVFLTPVIAWIYRTFLTKLVKEATARAKQLSAKIR